jgi:WD40 repeat protein
MAEPKPRATELDRRLVNLLFVAADGSGVVAAVPDSMPDSKEFATRLIALMPNSSGSVFASLPKIRCLAIPPDHTAVVFGCEESDQDLYLLPELPKLPPSDPPPALLKYAFPRERDYVHRVTALAVSRKNASNTSYVAVIREGLQASQTVQTDSSKPVNQFFFAKLQGEQIAPLTLPGSLPPGTTWGAAKALAFSDDAKWLAAGFQDGVTCVWRIGTESAKPVVLRTGILEDGMPSSSAAVTALCFLPHAKGPKPWLITGRADGTVRRWDLSAQLSIEEARKQLAGTLVYFKPRD